MDTQLQNTIDLAIRTQDSPAAIRVLVNAKKDPSLGLDSKVLLQLSYVRMNSLSPEQLLGLLHESILAAYTIPDFNLDERLKDYAETLDNVAEEMKFTHGLLKVLDTSDELLGKSNISVNNILVKPTIGNWLEDFSGFPSANKQKDALAEIEYFNKSSNLKTLSEDEKNTLKNIIKFYDQAVQTVALYDSIKVPQSEVELYKDYDLYKLIPGLEDDLTEEAEFKKHGGQPSVAPPEPILQPSPPPQPIERPKPISRPQPIPAPKQFTAPLQPTAPPPPQTPLPRVTPLTFGTPRTRNMDEVVRADSNSSEQTSSPVNLSKPGVVKDPTNIKMDEEQKRLEQQRKLKSEAIARKLEDLKSRNNKQPPTQLPPIQKP